MRIDIADAAALRTVQADKAAYLCIHSDRYRRTILQIVQCGSALTSTGEPGRLLHNRIIKPSAVRTAEISRPYQIMCIPMPAIAP